MKKIFISHVHEDKHYIHHIRKWIDDGLLTEVKLVVEEERDLRPEGYAVVRKHLKGLIEQCHIALVLVGENTHNHDWIRAESELANSVPVPIIVAQIGGTTGAVPKILTNLECINYQLKPIKQAIDKMPVRQFKK